MTECRHTRQYRKDGETGDWCMACNVKVYDVDPRECKDCAHHKRLHDGSICNKYLMGVTPTMHVTFSVSEGTCWTPKGEQ